MSDKSSSTDDEGPRDEEPARPRKEGNPWARQRAFARERGAVLRPRDDKAASEGSARPGDDEGQSNERTADEPADFKTRMTEYRRRQRRMPRPATESARAPEGGPAPDDEDDKSS
ncbi:MAG TPA: hypothetical protein VF297_01625 [Pyrinomonadaceae bacterium]